MIQDHHAATSNHADETDHPGRGSDHAATEWFDLQVDAAMPRRPWVRSDRKAAQDVRR